MKGKAGNRLTVVIMALLLAATASIMIPGHAMASTPPTTTLTISGPVYGSSPVYVNSLSQFTLSAVDANGSDAAGIWYHWDDYDYVEYTGPFTATVEFQSPGAPILPIDLEGPCTLYFNATDTQGNHEPVNTVEVFVDNYGPATDIHFDGEHWGEQPVYLLPATNITLTALDSGSGLASTTYRIDGGGWSTYTGPFGIQGTGIHTIEYRSLDNLGNQEQTHTLTAALDSAEPTVTVSVGQPSVQDWYITPQTPISITATDADSGVGGIYYRIDQGAWLNYTVPLHLSAEGEHTLEVYAADMLGNRCEIISRHLEVDITPPEVSVPGAAGGILELEQGQELVFNVSDAGVGSASVFYSTDDGQTWDRYLGPVPLDRSTEVRYYAEDALGNTGSEYSLSVKVPGNLGLAVPVLVVCIIAFLLITISRKKNFKF